jgi:lipopolysaccharide export system permease protein
MPILTRYVLLDLLKVFLLTLTGMTLMMILVGAFREALANGLGLWQVAKLIPYLLPSALLFAVPGTALFVACTVFGRMSSSNEIVAIKSLGISPMVVIWPVLIFAFLLSLGTVWLNDLAVSWGKKNATRVIIESVEEIAYSMLSVKKYYSNKQFSINVQGVDGRSLLWPTFTLAESEDSPAMTIYAQSAELKADPPRNVLTVKFYKMSIEGRGASFNDDDTQLIDIPLVDNTRTEVLTPSNLALRHIPEEARKQKILVRHTEQQLAVRTAFSLVLGPLTQLNAPVWNQTAEVLAEQKYRQHRLATEPHRRWSNGFSCLCFVFLGAPLAIRLRNSDYLQSFFLVFGPILICYYPLLAYGVDRAKTGALPPYAVWLGNGLVALAGLWHLRKILRY